LSRQDTAKFNAARQINPGGDRRVGDAVELVVAARLGRINVAGIERIEKFQHALSVKSLDHPFLRRGYARLALSVHCESRSAGLNQQNIAAL